MSTDAESASAEADTALRLRLSEIAAELGDLSDFDLPAKHRLNLEADELRNRLSPPSEDDAERLKDWASRSGRKGKHAHDPEAAAALVHSTMEQGN